MIFANYDHAGVGAAVNGDTVYVAMLFSTDMGLKPRLDEGAATAITSWESPSAAAKAPAPKAPAAKTDSPRLRGSQGVR
jgi:hypothetical protein